MVDFQKLLYLELRYELDQILEDAVIRIFKGNFINPPYSRTRTVIEYTKDVPSQ